MTESSDREKGSWRHRGWLIGALLLAQAASAGPLAAKTLTPVEPPAPLPATRYSDGNKLVGLDEFRGRTVVLNLWATWCSPCLKEMPALDRLAGKLAAEGIAIVALSLDDGGPAQVLPYLKKLKVTRLINRYDPAQRAFQDFAVRGLPTTLIISPQGRVVARLEGAAVWDSKEMIRQIRALAGKS